jgi:dihydroxy-acid dehydratase
MNHEGMKFSLLSRELIADSIEAVVHGLAYDALIGFGGCDKTLPGVMMGMIRCNVPSIFIYGGSALPGRFEGKALTVLDSYEAVGSFMTGEIDEATLVGIERTCLPTIGACAGQFTANTMGMVSEAMGMTIPNVSMVPGVYAERARYARRAGRLIMQMLQRGGPLPRESRWKTARPSSPRPAARPTRRCICRRLRTRPAYPSRWTMSARCLRARL